MDISTGLLIKFNIEIKQSPVLTIEPLPGCAYDSHMVVTSIQAVPPPDLSPFQGRAAHVAHLLRQRIEAIGVSDVLLGYEKDLTGQYGVSRGTLRSAVRELERQGLVRMVRGRNGGLYVSGSPIPVAAHKLCDYLTLSDAALSDIAHFAMRLYQVAAVAVAQRCSLAGGRPAAVDRAIALSASPPAEQRYIDTWSLIRRALVEAAGNRTITFLHVAFHAAYRDALTAELHLGGLEAPRTRAIWKLERDLVQVAAAGRVEDTRRAAELCTDLEASYIRQTLADGMLSRTLRPETLYQPLATKGKLAHQTLRALHAAVRQSRLASGDRLGSVMSLAQHFGVSVDVMRDALRQGQECGLVALRRGRCGGVFVAGPAREVAIEDAAAYLRTLVSPDEVAMVQRALGTPRNISARLAMEILRRAGVSELGLRPGKDEDNE